MNITDTLLSTFGSHVICRIFGQTTRSYLLLRYYTTATRWHLNCHVDHQRQGRHIPQSQCQRDCYSSVPKYAKYLWYKQIYDVFLGPDILRYPSEMIFILIQYIYISSPQCRSQSLLLYHTSNRAAQIFPSFNVGWLLCRRTFYTSYEHHVAREIGTFCTCISTYIISRFSYVQVRESLLEHHPNISSVILIKEPVIHMYHTNQHFNEHQHQ